MAFPLTHLLVADEILARYHFIDESQFTMADARFAPVYYGRECSPQEADAALVLLGSIAPDGVHYREGFTGESMSNIGHAKKITHLCPVSDEKWGAVTDNDGWISIVKAFAKNHKDPLSEGYAIHVLTDIYNNMTLWDNFRTRHPKEAAKGYKSGYYQDLKEIDLWLYQTKVKNGRIKPLLAKAVAKDIPELVTANEITAIQNSILCKSYEDPTPGYKYMYISYDETLQFIQDTADFIMQTIKGGTQ